MITKRALLLATSALVLTLGRGFSQSSGQELIQVRWDGSNDNWSQQFHWIPTRTVPNDTATEFYSVLIESGNVALDIPAVVSRVELKNPEFNLDQPLTTDTFILDGSRVTGETGLRTNGNVILRRGVLNHQALGPAAFSVGGAVRKQGFGFSILAPSESGGDYEVFIDQGTLQGGSGGWGTNEGSITITNPEFARLMTSSLTTIFDDVHLNNARGFSGLGAFVTERASSSSVAGDIYLGDTGSVLGLEDRMRIRGSIHGGNLEIKGSGILEIRTGAHTYSGTTSVGVNGRFPLLLLRDEGAILSSNAIEIGGNGAIHLQNETQLLADRLPDTAPITFYGGTIDFAQESLVHTTERAGQVVLAQGAATISAGQRSSWAFESLNRSGFATVAFDIRRNPDQTEPTVRFDAPPALANSILGGWATYSNSDFAAYDDTLGIVPLADRVARPDTIEGASPTAHVRIPPSSGETHRITSDNTIGTLVIDASDVDVNLSGHRLTINDGGLFLRGSSNADTVITNGELTAGIGAEESALYLRALQDVSVPASIVDNAAGGPVSLVKSGDGDAFLSGSNRHTGVTVAQEGRIFFNTMASVPTGGHLWADGAGFLFDYHSVSPAPKQLSRITITQGGFIGINLSGGGNPVIDAEEYLLESGSLQVPLAGDGVIRKVTDGIVELGGNSPDFIGDVLIERGVLVASGRNSDVDQRALGNGQTTIYPHGMLVHGAVLPGQGYYLLEANLNLAGGDVGFETAIRSPRYDFDGEWEVSAPSRILLFDYTGADEFTLGSGENAPADIRVLQEVDISHGSGLTILGEGVVSFLGGIRIADQAFLELPNGTASISGFSSASQSGALAIRGSGKVILPSIISNSGGGQLTIEVNREATTELTGPATTIQNGVTLALNGFTSGNLVLVLEGGTLTGSELGGLIINRAGVLAPGEGVAEVEIAELRQEESGVLQIDIIGGEISQSDLIRTGSANLSGLLHVSTILETLVSPGDVFDLIIADSLSAEGLGLRTEGFVGRLDVVPVTLGPDQGKSALRLFVVVPEPSSVVSVFFILGVAAGLRRRR